jgi:hypothetical protein
MLIKDLAVGVCSRPVVRLHYYFIPLLSESGKKNPQAIVAITAATNLDAGAGWRLR